MGRLGEVKRLTGMRISRKRNARLDLSWENLSSLREKSLNPGQSCLMTAVVKYSQKKHLDPELGKTV